MTSISSVRARRLPSHRLRTWAGIALFLLPAFALYVLFVIYPIAQAARFSLYDWNGLEPLTDFVGLANFERALADPVFRGAISALCVIAPRNTGSASARSKLARPTKSVSGSRPFQS